MFQFIKIAEALTINNSTNPTLCSEKNPLTSVSGLLNFFTCTIISSVIPLLFSLATASFIWGIVQFFLNPENEEGRKKGKSFMTWGLIALFVMTSMWGIVALLGNTFQIKTLVPQVSQ